MDTDLSKEHQALARFLLERSTTAYKFAATERKQIHAQEWDEDPEFTVLGEVDLLDTKIAGMASSFIGTGRLCQQSGEAIEMLRKSKVISNSKISTWTTQHASSFPRYVEYLCALETLRLFLLEICLDQQGEG
jgi:hypothetical protein